MPFSFTRGGVWWYPQSVYDAIAAAPPIPLDDQGRPTTLLGRPIVYADDLPDVPVDLFVPKKKDEGKPE